VQRGIFAAIPISNSDSTQYNFKINLELKGSQKIYFSPIGKTTDVKLTSSWNSPSYNGSFLPDDKDDINGFNAHWNILHLNRDFPQAWTGNEYSINNSDFGVDLILPVDNYQKTYRSIKYAILFIAFTFIIFFFIEVMKKVFIHPIQYILVGFALIIFYTLLLSIGEYLSFNTAFLISAIATILLITAYVKTILKSFSLATLIAGILTILYGFIFIIIQVQDYALLIGSIGVFLILALVMYFSRKIDWYNLNLNE
ncbi:MAG TPA: cell envelope integrity protein CreD, partial [Bacteroidia bacterium]